MSSYTWSGYSTRVRNYEFIFDKIIYVCYDVFFIAVTGSRTVIKNYGSSCFFVRASIDKGPVHYLQGRSSVRRGRRANVRAANLGLPWQTSCVTCISLS